MRIKILVLGLVCFILLINCIGCSSNCDDEMDQIKGKHGTAEEVNTYSSSDYNSETWWYWSKGISYTFKWGSLIEGDCDVSTYTFDPISADATAEEKASVKATLLDRQIFLKGIY